MIARAGVVALLLAAAPAWAHAQEEAIPDAPIEDTESVLELETSAEETGRASELGTPTPPPDYVVEPSRAITHEPSDSDAARIARLDTVLSAHARASSGGRLEGGILGLVSGLVIVGAGIALVAIDEASDPLFFILGGLSIALGVGTATTGALTLGMTTAPERRYAMFQRDRAAGALTARRIGRYEGALWSEAETAADARVLNIASAVLLGATGGVEIAFTAEFAPDDTLRAIGYGFGALYVVLGVLQLVFAFQESDAERRFREYEEGTPPLAIRPWASPSGAGLSVAGGF